MNDNQNLKEIYENQIKLLTEIYQSQKNLEFRIQNSELPKPEACPDEGRI